MTESGGSGRYLLGDRSNTFRRYRLFNEVYQPGTLERLAALRVSPSMTVLEIGCGIGDMACHMAKNLVPEGHVTAFDRAANLVDLAKRQASEAGIENVTFLCASAEEFPFEPDRFDLAQTRYVLSYLSGAGETLRKVFGSLKPSGLFFGE